MQDTFVSLFNSGQDHLRRLQRGVNTAARSEALNYLRENGIDESTLSNAEFADFILLIESPKQRGTTWHKLLKGWMFRQMRNRHNPSITARYLGASFNETIQYFFVFTCYVSLLVGIGCTELECPLNLCMHCAALRTVMTVHLLYYDIKWLYKLLRLLWTKGVQLVQFAKQIPEYIQVCFEVFLGWRITAGILGILLSIYAVPVVLPEMSVSALFVDYYEQSDLPMAVRILRSVF
jgi:hypothetical protein